MPNRHAVTACPTSSDRATAQQSFGWRSPFVRRKTRELASNVSEGKEVANAKRQGRPPPYVVVQISSLPTTQFNMWRIAMKRLITTLLLAGLAGLAGMPQSAEAGIFGRRFGCSSSGTRTAAVAPSAGATADAGRRYSYEPGTPNVTRRTTSDGVLPGQRHLLPKTDPRRYLND